MTDPRSADSQQPAQRPSSASPPNPSFAPPSSPGFAPPPAAGAAPAPGSWPAAGAVPFTPHGRTTGGTAVAALVLSIVGAVIGLLVGWGFPASIIGLVLARRARREPGSSRALPAWSVALAVVSGLGSVGWLAYSLVVILT